MRLSAFATLAVACTAWISAPASAAGDAAIVGTISVPGAPFASLSTRDGTVLFVSVSAAGPGSRAGIVVFRRTGKELTQIGFVGLRTLTAFGMALLADDSTLLVADGEGVALVDATAAKTGARTDPVYVVDDPDAGTIEVVVTADGRTAFAADENRAALSVLRIERQPSGQPGAVRTGSIDVDRAPVGLALSPNGATLYVAGELALRGPATADAGGDLVRRCGPRGVVNGTLTAVDVARRAVVARLAAGCSPVRVAVTADGVTVWVSVRGDDRVIAFDAAKIRTDAAHALVAQARVGSAPVGIALLASDTLLAVANSNRFDPGARTSTVTVLNLGATPSVRTSVTTGSFPREFSVSPDGALLYLTNYRSRSVEIIDVTRL
jgi:DNA-binding beta-propeller fold protein YncE